MRTRVIVVPKDKEAEAALDFDNATKEQLIEFYLTEEEFFFLYQEGIFELINDKGKTDIDDFEDASIVENSNLISVLEVFDVKISDLTTNKCLTASLLNLFKEALSRKTGIYFFF